MLVGWGEREALGFFSEGIVSMPPHRSHVFWGKEVITFCLGNFELVLSKGHCTDKLSSSVFGRSWKTGFKLSLSRFYRLFLKENLKCFVI